MQQTAVSRLAAILLGEELDVWVASRRARGISWLNIARELKEATNGQVSYSHEGLRQRFGLKSNSAGPSAEPNQTPRSA